MQTKKKKDEFSMNIINALNKQILMHLFTLTFFFATQPLC